MPSHGAMAVRCIPCAIICVIFSSGTGIVWVSFAHAFMIVGSVGNTASGNRTSHASISRLSAVRWSGSILTPA